MAVARQVPLAPDPLAVARILAGADGLAVLQSADPIAPFGRWSFVGGPVDRLSARLDPLADDDGEGMGGSGVAALAPRWIGVLPYEATRHLERPGWTPPDRRPAPAILAPRWRRHRAVAAIDHHEGRVFAVGLSRLDAELLGERLRSGRPAPLADVHLSVADADPPPRHMERIVAAKELIERGDLYQVNLARRLLVRLARRPDSGALLSLSHRLLRAAPTPFGACLSFPDGTAVLSTTPELFLHAAAISSAISSSRRTLWTTPIKGTRARGVDAANDAALVQSLAEDPKEHAELAMIIDVERHDLGRIAEVGSVRLLGAPAVTTLRTVHHREARLVAVARAGVAREEILAAMLPSGSVTGAPKRRAMEVIASLESSRRGLYTGAIGHVAHDGSMTLAMAIRTLVLDGEVGEYWTGGGIVADSDPARELEETRWKAVQLARIAGPPG